MNKTIKVLWYELYEAAGTLEARLPRIAFQNNDLKFLFNYVTERNTSEDDQQLFFSRSEDSLKHTTNMGCHLLTT